MVYPKYCSKQEVVMNSKIIKEMQDKQQLECDLTNLFIYHLMNKKNVGTKSLIDIIGENRNKIFKFTCELSYVINANDENCLEFICTNLEKIDDS
jgi:hypothetical protein